MSEHYKLNKKSEIHCNGDGYITKDGHTMFQQDIVQDLNCMRSQLKQKGAEVERLRRILNLWYNLGWDESYREEIEDLTKLKESDQ